MELIEDTNSAKMYLFELGDFVLLDHFSLVAILWDCLSSHMYSQTQNKAFVGPYNYVGIFVSMV